MIAPLIEVVAAAIYDARGNLLLARRAIDGSAESGLWEFPGGKVEPGESLEGALRREIAEELDVQLGQLLALPRARAIDRQRGIALNLLTGTLLGDQPKRRIHQELRWVRPHECIQLPLGVLDRQLAKWAGAPTTYHITDPTEPLREQPLSAGAAPSRAWLLARWPGATDEVYASRLEELSDRCGVYPLMQHDRFGDASDTIATVGTHLSAKRAAQFEGRPQSPQQWLCVSCHSAAELAHATQLDADFVVLGPIRETASHPGSPGMGWPTFIKLVDTLPMPVLALGGMQPADLPSAMEHRGSGVAGISSFWRDFG